MISAVFGTPRRGGLLRTGTAGPAALADPPAGDDRTLSCTALLAQVDDWPGTAGNGYRIFSDAYELHLLAQPECQDGA